jgi:hypothetical protein
MGHVTATIEVATKKLVDGLLAANEGNRNIRPAVVARYEHDIATGNWHLTGQGISVGEDGMLIDGQHRLQAMRNCGYPPLQILVVRGLTNEARAVVDQHAKRSIRDALCFAYNKRVSYNSPAICNVLWYADGHRRAPSVHESNNILTEYWQEIEAVTCAPSNRDTYTAPHLAGFVRVMKQRPYASADIVSFIKSVEDGENLNRTMPAYHLRNYVVNRGKEAGRADAMIKYNKTIKATEAHLDGKQMGNLKL